MASFVYEETVWWLGKVVYALGVVVGSIIAVIHTRNVCLDARISECRLNAFSYKVVSYCTLLSIYCYVLNMVVSVLSSAPFVYEICPFIAINGSWSYLLAKMFMYLVFIWRLHAVYDESAYRYSKTTLKIMTGFILFVSLLINVLVTIRIRPYAGHAHHAYMRYCDAHINSYIAACIGLYDFGLSVYSCVAFINPLRQLIKNTMNSATPPSSPADTNTVSKQMTRTRTAVLLDVGAKCAILTSFASVTTILLMLLIGVGFGNGLAPFDFVANMLCMMLMTGYYQRADVYRKLCCVPIRCSKWCMLCCCGFSEDAAFLAADNGKSSRTEIVTTAFPSKSPEIVNPNSSSGTQSEIATTDFSNSQAETVSATTSS